MSTSMSRNWDAEPVRGGQRSASAVAGALLLCALLAGAAAAQEPAGDVVRLRGPSGRGEQQVRGTVVDYTGQQIIIRRESGQEERYDGRRVIDIVSSFAEAHTQAERLMAEGRYGDSLPLLREALRAETRPWVRRRILARSVLAYQQAGQVEVAGEAFSLLLQSDPATPEFAVIPLAWLNEAPPASVESAAGKWLASPQPAVRLLGASWLLTSPRRGEAARQLEQLAHHDDPAIALLATSQLWRTQLVTVKAEDLARWEQLVERMPASVRSGPYWLLGQAAARLGQHESAALYLLRIPLLYPEQQALAAEALLAAARQLDELQRSGEAQRLYRELATEYPFSPLAAEAQRRLNPTRTP